MSEFDRIVAPLRAEQSEQRKDRLQVGRYVLGHPGGRYALTAHRGQLRFHLPWQWPRGGWWIGRYIVWWGK